MANRHNHKTDKKGLNRKLLTGVVLITTTLLAIFVGYYLFFQHHTENWTAAIIDQLVVQEELANPIFNANCTSILNASGFDVKYYSGSDVNVMFYKDLPSKGGKIIILRAHSAVRDNTDWVDLFTSESFSKDRHTDLASDRQISKAQMYSSDEWYFAIGPTFVDRSMTGLFDSNCVIILMGCNSLNETTMAEALVGRGAKVVIGWTSWVEASYTDSFTIQLLQRLLAENPETIKGAISKINHQIELYHPNRYNTTLTYYPTSDEAASHIIPTRNNEISPGFIGELFQILLFTTLAKRKCDVQMASLVEAK